MKIEILGGGCTRCDQLYASTVKAVESNQIEAEVVKDTEYDSIIKYGITSTPALVVDGQLKSSGKVLKSDEVLAILKQ